MLRLSASRLVFLLAWAVRTHSTLVRRAEHASALIGDYIYVDGGQFSQTLGGQYLWDIETHTLSIPVDTSWSAATLNITLNPKTSGAPLLNGAKLWSNPTAPGFYSFGGEVSNLWTASVPPRALWNFTADGHGGGNWVDQTSIAGDAFGSIIRTSEAASEVLGDTAYYLGGISSNNSNPSEINAGIVLSAAPGLTSFNMGTGLWKTESANGNAGIGKTSNSAMLNVPRFGTEGVLIIMGGTYLEADPSGTNSLNAAYVPFDNVSIFDPTTNSWYSQLTTGAIPEDRERFCVVGVQAADISSYEIFLYGGLKVIPERDTTWTEANIQLDEVFVLSLPRFEWIKANYTAQENRHSHTCHVAGNRQMITIGGIDGSNPGVEGYNIVDPFPQAIGVFDLTEMIWVPDFTHDAAPYERPEMVEALYSGGNRFPAAWSSPEVEKLFNTTSTSSAPSATSTPTGNRSFHDDRVSFKSWSSVESFGGDGLTVPRSPLTSDSRGMLTDLHARQISLSSS